MRDVIEKYVSKLLRDGSATPDSIRLYALEDRIITNRDDEWLPVFTGVFAVLNVSALLFARPTLPFADLLVRKTGAGEDRIVPKDSETRVFLHDIPFIRKSDWEAASPMTRPRMIADRLKERKAVIIEDAGVVATGGLTVEQAYIGFSTIIHTTLVKYLLDLLTQGFRLEGEREAFEGFESSWNRPVDIDGLSFTSGPFESSEEPGMRNGGKRAIYEEISRVGRYTVEKGLVDSFFGNISAFDGSTIYISQTASSLDELEGHIVPVPLDGSSTAGISASSELPAHKAIYLTTDYRTVVHGHPKFSVIMSMHCTEEGCDIEDCTRNCDRKRFACGVPVVTGETGAGGLSRTVPPAVREAGACIVYGHGVFAAGRSDFREAFERMVEIENQCREEYFATLHRRGRGGR
jgi:ribulose-5-phosphate 4-epimerase/fuculose-1-phosphate aldolase